VLERDVAAVARLRNNAKPLADQLEAAAKEIVSLEDNAQDYLLVLDGTLDGDWPLSRERRALSAEVMTLRAGVERLTKQADEDERATGQLIDQRDKREAQIDAIADALGDEGEWSNLHDRGAAALELADGIVADLTRLRALESRLLALFETADPDVISQTMEMVIRDRDDAATRADRAAAEIERTQPVVEAALTLVDVKREAQAVFRTGLDGMPVLVRTSPVHKMLADKTSFAGSKLERVVDVYRRGRS
jgi:hypothetical protein